MNGVTGRMGTNQHLIRSIKAIHRSGRRQAFPITKSSLPDPILVGRNAAKLEGSLRKANGGRAFHDRPRQGALADPYSYSIYFDAQTHPAAAPMPSIAKAIKPPERTSTARSRQGFRREEAVRALRRWRRRLASSRVSCKTSFGPPRPASSCERLHRIRFLWRRSCPCAASSVTGSSPATRSDPASAPIVELPQGRRWGNHRRYALPLALCGRQPLRRTSRLFRALVRHTYSRAHR